MIADAFPESSRKRPGFQSECDAQLFIRSRLHLAFEPIHRLWGCSWGFSNIDMSGDKAV